MRTILTLTEQDRVLARRLAQTFDMAIEIQRDDLALQLLAVLQQFADDMTLPEDLVDG